VSKNYPDLQIEN